jgi:hypothetical protein
VQVLCLTSTFLPGFCGIEHRAGVCLIVPFQLARGRGLRARHHSRRRTERAGAQFDMIVGAMLSLSLAAELLVGSGAKWRIVAPLILACLTIVIAIPVAAARSKLHMPAYIGIAILAFAASLVFGEMSGVQRIAGSIVGVVLSMACFLSIAAVVGSILALLFYREPPEV